ncbi:hypothetical protein QE152_g25596 [Popillia japonica]|uniref:Uncharacterized protein n=1 Tax=Popillia japonica TaxID=7064 RepID=A0AAW1K043_POPJA
MQIEEDFERLRNNISNDINEISGEESNAVDINETEEEEEELVKPTLKRKDFIIKKRHQVFSGLENQAKKMKNNSDKLPKVNIGETVRIPIPNDDRARGDLRNIIGIILSAENDNYEIGTKHGKLSQLYARNQFSKCPVSIKHWFIALLLLLPKSKWLVQYKLFQEKLMVSEDVPNNDISLRECARKCSNMGGQGYDRCFCNKNAEQGDANDYLRLLKSEDLGAALWGIIAKVFLSGPLPSQFLGVGLKAVTKL